MNLSMYVIVMPIQYFTAAWFVPRPSVSRSGPPPVRPSWKRQNDAGSGIGWRAWRHHLVQCHCFLPHIQVHGGGRETGQDPLWYGQKKGTRHHFYRWVGTDCLKSYLYKIICIWLTFDMLCNTYLCFFRWSRFYFMFPEGQRSRSLATAQNRVFRQLWRTAVQLQRNQGTSFGDWGDQQASGTGRRRLETFHQKDLHSNARSDGKTTLAQ